MRKINVTFSIPEQVNALLHATVGKRELSQFVTKAIEKAIEDERQTLKEAYLAANKDQDRKNVIKDWETIENEEWEE